MSWNIHRNYRSPEVRASLGRLLRRWDPDVVLLQEVPLYGDQAFWELPGVGEILDRYHLEYATVHRVGRPSAYYPFTQSGVVTLSSGRPASARAIALPVVSAPKLGRHHTVRRVALCTDHELAGTTVRVLNLHLENTARPGGRMAQLRHAVAQVGQLGDAATVVAGDFNMLRRGVVRALDQVSVGGFAVAVLDGRPRLRPVVDHFAVREAAVVSGRVLREPGSDHLPVLLEVELEPGSTRDLHDSSPAR